MNKELNELRKQPHWSFSSLNGFLNICSLQWAFKYVYKLEPEAISVNLVFGSAFHRAAECLTVCRMNGELLNEIEAEDLFAECWLLQCRNNSSTLRLSSDEFEELNTTGQRMIKCLNREWNETDIIDLNKAFSVNILGVTKPLIGEIDLIVKDSKGKITLVDWKTSARRWSECKADKDLQATCFMYAYEQITPEFKAKDNQFRYDVITKTKEPSYIQHYTMRTEDDFLRLSQLLKIVDRAVEAELFLPNEQGYFCKSCEYAGACKEWHHKQARTISIPNTKLVA